MNYDTVILISWATFILVWAALAFNVKRDIRGGGFSILWYRYLLLRIAIVVLAVFVALRVATGSAHFANADAAIFHSSVFMPPLALGWIGAVLTALGVLFAIWARIYLGTNWSPAPAVKEKHELVTSGPYALVRHPIYTGILFATFGASLTGSTVGIVMLVIGSIIFFFRIGKEERIMLELFPNVYPAYQTRTKRLIPFLY